MRKKWDQMIITSCRKRRFRRYERRIFKGKDQGPFLFGNSVFERKQREKDLGVIICDNLNWSEHIKSRVSKAYSMFHMIRRNVSPRTSKGAKMNLYRGLLVPILTYGMQVSHANTNSLSALELFQARVTKWIDHEPDYKRRLHRLNLLPISLYIELHDILLLSRIFNDKYNYDWEPKVRFPLQIKEREQQSPNYLYYRNCDYLQVDKISGTGLLRFTKRPRKTLTYYLPQLKKILPKFSKNILPIPTIII